MTIKKIMAYLEHEKRYHDLEDVEIIEEDAQAVMDLINNGTDEYDAVSIVLNNIYECLA